MTNPFAQFDPQQSPSANPFAQFGRANPFSQWGSSEPGQPVTVSGHTPDVLKAVKRQIGLTGRAAATAVNGLAGLVGDPLNATLNAVTGSHLPAVSQSGQRLIDAVLPTPQNATERVVNDAASMLAGVGSGSGIARGVAKIFKSAQSMPVKTILNQLGHLNPGDLANAAAGGAGAGVAHEMGAQPVTQAAAGLLAGLGVPHALPIGKMAVQGMVRGGETKAQHMVQRMADFHAAGAVPSMGLASGSKTWQGIENLLSQSPGAVGVMERAKAGLTEGMARRAEKIRDALSTDVGAEVAGRMLQHDLKTGLRDRVLNTYEQLNDRLMDLLPQDKRFPVTHTLNALRDTTAIHPDMPRTTAELVTPRLSRLHQAFTRDIQPPAGAGQTLGAVDIGAPPSALRSIRSSIGKDAADQSIIGSRASGQMKHVYAGLSEDLRKAAQQTDRGLSSGPAERAWQRANQYYKAGQARIQRIQPFVNKTAPEQAYTALLQGGKENVSTLRAVKRSVSPETWRSVAATTVDRMGRAHPSRQNDLGEIWSAERFLTNWNTLKPHAKQELFAGFENASQARQDMDKIASAASMLRDASKVWSNPSGTAAAGHAKLTLLGMVMSSLTGHPYLAAGMAGSMAVANGAARLMTHPGFVHWLAQSSEVPLNAAGASLQTLGQIAHASNDAQFKEDAEHLMRRIQDHPLAQ